MSDGSRNHHMDRATLGDQVAKALAERILNGEWKAGELIPSQSELARQFDVSVPVIREALKTLSAQGLVNVIHGKRTVVMPPNVQQISDAIRLITRREVATLAELIELRSLIEPGIAALAAQRATNAQIDELEQIIAPSLSGELDTEALIEIEVRFHLALAKATGNSLCPAFMRVFTEFFTDLLHINLLHTQRHAPTEHLDIVQALRAHDPRAAQKAMLVQINHSRQDMANALPASIQEGLVSFLGESTI